jgi:serine/threonine protein kinase
MDLERDTPVALKTVLHHDADALARFKREFRALQDIHHPNLVSLGELVAEGDELFFTMELLEGVDLVAPRARAWTLRSHARRSSSRRRWPSTGTSTWRACETLSAKSPSGSRRSTRPARFTAT